MKHRKPARAKPLKESPSKPSNHETDILKILTRENGRLQRRYKMARHCLRSNVHVKEALAVLRRVSRSSEMHATQKDVALRILDKYQRKHGTRTVSAASPQGESGDVMRLPMSKKAEIGCVAGPVEWIPDAEWDALRSDRRPDRKKAWLPRGYSIKSGDKDDE